MPLGVRRRTHRPGVGRPACRETVRIIVLCDRWLDMFLQCTVFWGSRARPTRGHEGSLAGYASHATASGTSSQRSPAFHPRPATSDSAWPKQIQRVCASEPTAACAQCFPCRHCVCLLLCSLRRLFFEALAACL